MNPPNQNKKNDGAWHMARILLIEDDSTIADGIILGLKSHGMMVDWFGDAVALKNSSKRPIV